MSRWSHAEKNIFIGDVLCASNAHIFQPYDSPYVRGLGNEFVWRDVLKTLEKPAADRPVWITATEGIEPLKRY